MHALIGRLLFLLCLSFSVSAAQPESFVTVRGKQIVAPDGSALLLRGVNLGNWLVPEGYMFKFDSASSPRMINSVISELVGPGEARMFWKRFRESYITREDIRYIRAIGLNSIRVPFNWRLFMSEDGEGTRAGPGFDLLDKVIGWSREAGLWVILDMHCAPGGQTGDNIDDSWGYPFLFDSPEEQTRATDLWKEIAGRYAHERCVIGYDLLNEPIPPFFDKERLNPLLEPLYKRIVAAIREVDTNHVIFLGGAQWDTNFGVFGPPFDPKLVYTFHKYWCDTTQAMIEEYVNFRDTYSVSLWLGESGENSDAWIGSFRRLLERNTIGWCFWPYKKMDAPTCLVTFAKPDRWQILVRYQRGPRAGYASIRSHRPPVEEVKEALNEFLENCRFKNCRPNPGYHEALGVATVEH